MMQAGQQHSTPSTRRSLRALVAAGAVCAALALSTGQAIADGYTGNDRIAVSDGSVTPGQSITVFAGTFDVGTVVSIYAQGTTPVLLGTATADSRGRIEKSVVIPTSLALGTHRIDAVGVASGAASTASINIAITSNGADLPGTGMDLMPWLVVAGGAVVTGAVALQFRRRRVA